MILTSKDRQPSTRWTQQLKTTDEKERFLQALKNDTLVLGRLRDIIEEDIAALSRREVRLDSYDSPSWAYRQAHLNGVSQSLQGLRDLLSFLK
jgi:hypothetical protein